MEMDRGRIEEAGRDRSGWRDTSASVGGLEAQHDKLPKSSSGKGEAFRVEALGAKEFLGDAAEKA